MRYLLSHFHAIFLCLVWMLVAAVISCLLQRIVRKRFTRLEFKRNMDISTVMFGALSMLYALIIAFVIVAVWEDYEDLNDYISQQTDKFGKIRLQSASLPDSVKNEINVCIHNYVNTELAERENANNAGTDTLIAPVVLYKMRLHLLALNTKDNPNSNLYSAIDDDIVDAIALHYDRYNNAHSCIPRLVWFALLIGSGIIMFFSWFFRAEPVAVEYLYNSLFAAMIAMCLFVIYALDHPMLGTAGVSYEPYRHLLRIM
jgi:hypothetical protein